MSRRQLPEPLTMQQVLPAFAVQPQTSLQTTADVFMTSNKSETGQLLTECEAQIVEALHMQKHPSSSYAQHVLLTLLRVCSGVCLESMRIHHSIVRSIHTGSTAACQSDFVHLCTFILPIQKHYRGLHEDRASCDATLGNGHLDRSCNPLDVGFQCTEELHQHLIGWYTQLCPTTKRKQALPLQSAQTIIARRAPCTAAAVELSS